MNREGFKWKEILRKKSPKKRTESQFDKIKITTDFLNIFHFIDQNLDGKVEKINWR